MMLSRRELIVGGVATGLARGAAGRKLFDGRSMTGWRHYANGIWTIEDGVLVGKSDHSKPGPGYLFTEDLFGDFRLHLEWFITKGGNSGVYVRQPVRPLGPKGDDRPAQLRDTDGVEIQIDYNDPKNLTGAVYNRKKPETVVGAEDHWNRYDIECRGDRVVVRLNGEEVNAWSPLPAARGMVGMQIHGGQPHDHVVRFRNIRIEVL
jgi:3-keto-disaccharide hydrolase